MIKLKFLLLALLFQLNGAFAQFQDGAVCPNFTVTDLDGKTHNLYADYLDKGKTVLIDFFATWCGPCWFYHQAHHLQNFQETYGPPGTGQVMVLGIEVSGSTNADCLRNLPTCSGSTFGDWTAGTNYPLINNDSLYHVFGINQYPMRIMVCAFSRTLYNMGSYTAEDLWFWKTVNCQASSATDEPETGRKMAFSPNPATGLISLKFQVDNEAETAARVEVFDAAGKMVLSDFRNLVLGENDFQFDATNWKSGIYAIRLTAGRIVWVEQLVVQE